MTAHALPLFPHLAGLQVSQAHRDQCAQWGHADRYDTDRCPRCGVAASPSCPSCGSTLINGVCPSCWEKPSVAEVNLCGGEGVIATIQLGHEGYAYADCPGCIGCDHDTVTARSAQMTAEQAFALLPAVDDEEW